MNNILSSIADDEKLYKYLCKRYKEKPQTVELQPGVFEPDPYGEHASELKERLQEEWQKLKEKALPES